MRVTFESYIFHIQSDDTGRKLLCITSEKELNGVKIKENSPEYLANAHKHSVFTRDLYEQHERSDKYTVFKNIISDIISNTGGYEFLQGLMRYLENDKATSYINRAIGEVKANK